MILIFNEELEKIEHILYFTKSCDSRYIDLMELVRCTYKHPDGPINILILEERWITKYARGTDDAAALILLEANQKIVEKTHGTNI